MTTRRHAQSFVSPWVRLAAFMAFLAVLSALWAPVSMLAQEVRTGQLGGGCADPLPQHRQEMSFERGQRAARLQE